MKNERHFASLDIFSKLITALTFVIIIYLLYQTSISLKMDSPLNANDYFMIGLLIFLIGVLLFSFCFMPLSYILKHNNLTINMICFSKNIYYNDIKNVRKISNKESFKIIRSFGNGGIFGYHGFFYIPGIGMSTFWASKRINLVLLVMKSGKRYVITPNDVNRFISQLDKRVIVHE